MENYYFEEDEVFEAYGKDYVTLSVIKNEKGYYIFVSELKDEIPTNSFEVFECLENGIRKVLDTNYKNKLLEEFSIDINKKIASLRQNNSEG